MGGWNVPKREKPGNLELVDVRQGFTPGKKF